MRYRRDRTPGATYFFTLVTQGRRPLFTQPGNIEWLRSTFARVKSAHPFRIDAIVVLPDHLHCLWTLPEGDADFAARWNLIKGGFTRALPSEAKPPRGTGERRERLVWQRRYWEHRIRDEDDYARHCDYIHWNPVKHGLVARAVDWPYSSFDRFVQAEIYSADWGDGDTDLVGVEAGE
jgi:putative transposase